MIAHILVPTDFSYDAYNALFYATQLFKNQKCTFHILHAYTQQSHFKTAYKSSRTSKKLVEFIHDKTTESLKETYHKIIADTEKNSLHHFESIAKNSSLKKAIKTYMSKKPIDLVVMGSKGRTGAVDIFLGGNTIQMIKNKINCPLLCIPKQIDYSTISKMAYITDFKHSLEKFSLPLVKFFAKTHKALLHIVHICNYKTLNASQEKNKAVLCKYFEDTSLEFYTITHEKSKAITIDKFVRAYQIDLLALCYYPHYFLDKLFREPVVLDLSLYTKIPLLILPAQE